VRNATLKTASQSLFRQSRQYLSGDNPRSSEPSAHAIATSLVMKGSPGSSPGVGFNEAPAGTGFSLSLEATLGVCVKSLRQVDEVKETVGTVVKARYPVFCATAFSAGFSVAVLALTASALPGAASRVTLRTHGQGIVKVGTTSIHCISASATQIVCSGTVTVPRGRYVELRERPKAGWAFSTWTGACRGSESTCRIRVVRPLLVGATFARRRG